MIFRSWLPSLRPLSHWQQAASSRVHSRRALLSPAAAIELLESRTVLTTIDLANLGAAGTTIFGADAEDRSGISVSDAGDVNGDGFDDLLIGASLSDATGNSKIEAGECYVVFGGPMMPATLDLANLGSAGIAIFGAETFDFTGISVSGAGDINGDGFDDLLVGAHHIGTPGVDEPLLRGKCYVIFGGVSLPGVVDLSNPGAAGVTISDASQNDFLGMSVSGAGDVNGDGFDDIIIGDFGAHDTVSGIVGTGASYVIFGGASLPATLNVDSLGAAGVTIFGAEGEDSIGRSVSSAGDVNGDGFDDVLVGTERGYASANTKEYAGESYVIFGRAAFPTVLTLSSLNFGGFTIYGADAEDRSGYSVSNAGDVNGDGFDDILIGAFGADAAENAKSDAGESYVIFGGTTFPSMIDLSALGTAGITIWGRDAGDESGHSVSGAGDVNGDGFDDILIGAESADPTGNSKPSAGEAYLIFGGPSLPAMFDMADLNGFGIAILGADVNDGAGRSVSSAGDLDGDGFDDLIIGAPIAYASGNSKIQAGESYVIFGRDFTHAITHAGTSTSETLIGNTQANAMVGGRGGDTLIGGGGADVIYGSEGTDTISISDTAFQRVDGGSGSDTLRVAGAGIALDLTMVADNKLTSFETIDLRGSGANSLTLNALEVLNLTSNSNSAHAANTLMVRRDADDAINMVTGWTRTPNTSVDGVTYNAFQNGAAKLLLEALPITIDLANLGTAGTTIYGADSHDLSGGSVRNAGDVNGDGYDDILIGARMAEAFAGETYLIFGAALPQPTIDLDSLGSAGITILGADAGDFSGQSVSRAGDVNGDGFDDILIGAYLADALSPSKQLAGASYVIFGGASLPTMINLANLDTAGITIFGADEVDMCGKSVSSVGDVNGDGFDDVLISAYRADASGNGKLSAGESYVIFGRASLPMTIDLANLGAAGVTIFGGNVDDYSGRSVSGAGDVNGDGFADLLIGAFRADASNDETSSAGESYLIFGRASLPTTIDLTNLGISGVTIFGTDVDDLSGVSVSSAGDVNGDGLDDFLIGAAFADASGNGKSLAGESYLIFGSVSLPATIELANLGAAGIQMFGANANDLSGWAVSNAGDVNGDGFDDLLIGAFGAESSAGESYMIFGSSSLPATIDLSSLVTAGITIFGVDAGDLSGISVSSAGDVNGDGFDDLVIGASSDSALGNAKLEAGESNVVYGGNDFTSSVTHLGTGSGEVLSGSGAANVMNGAGGNDTLIGLGGADVIYGGEGGDVLAVSDLVFQRVDGGNGSDTLRVDGAGVALNLMALADNKLTSIETIDLRGSGANSLTLNRLEVLNITSNSNPARTANTLTIRRDNDDSLNMGTGWAQGGNVVVGGTQFQTFTQGQATLQVEIPVAMNAELEGGQIVVRAPQGIAVDVLVSRDTGAQEIVVRSRTGNVVTNEFRFPISSVTGGLDATLSPQGDRFDASLAGLPVTVNGGDGNDSLTGGTANDQLVGGNGDDTLTGGLGQDTLQAGAGGLDLLFEIFNADLSLTPTQLTVISGGNTVVDSLSGFEKALILGGGSANRLDASLSNMPVTLFGGSGNDVLIGGNQADSLDGQGGNDTLTGGAGVDSFLGGAGNDTLKEVFDQNLTLTNSTLLAAGNGQADVTDKLATMEIADLSGGVSRNKIDLSGFAASLGATINGNGQSDTIIGSPGPDMIITLAAADVINGLGGADVVYSGGGNDTVNGGDGIDHINGQNGDDLISGDAGNDVLVGGAGRDTLNGGADNDFLSGQTDPGLLNGGDGNDNLQGNAANDTLNGDAGNDRLLSLQGNDLLSGGDGADTLFGGIGNDSLLGDAGADDLRGEAGSDSLNGGADADRINEVLDTNVTITGTVASGQIASVTLGLDSFFDVERINLTGGLAANFFDARTANLPVLLSGDAGNDTLLGGSKSDVISGGDGDDVLSGGAGTDVIDGGNGTDYIFEKADTNFTVNGVTITSAITGADTPTTIERIALIGGTGANKLDASLATVPVVLIGGRNNDTLLGGSAADTLSGGNRNDATVVGGDGTDSLDGGAGNNTLETDPSDTLITAAGDTSIADVFTLLPSWVDAI